MKTRKDLFKNLTANKELIQKSVSSKNASNYTRDETYWNPPWDATKKIGIATIAFLPFGNMFDETNQEFSPYIFTPQHSNLTGRNGKKYYNIHCPSGRNDFNQGDCPLCNKFFELYNGSETEKKLAAELGLSRKREFRGNIIVLKNDNNPDEVGKIFKWKFGLTIQQKINDKINPIDDDEPLIVHNVYDIVPFKVKIIEKMGYRNYDTSEWGSTGKTLADYLIPKATSEEKEKFIEEILDKLFRVEDYVTDSDFRSKEELERILNDVLLSNNLTPITETKAINSETATVSEKDEPEIDIGNELDMEEDVEIDETDISVDSDDLDLDKIFNDE
jgi:hypothetical protein